LKLFGRKKGRKLSLRKQSLINILLPNISLENEVLFQNIFNSDVQIFLEIGFGHGENLIQLSKERPEWTFLGIEPFINGVASLLERIDTEKISNIYVLNGDGRDFLKKLPKDTISEACVLFPDPWQKSKHVSRRIIQQEFLNDMSKILIKNSTLHLSSDHPKAQEWILRSLTNNKNYDWDIEKIYDCYQKPKIFGETKYMKKSIREMRKAMWFKFRNIKEC
tara:strand:+ start:940 stop:1602 length:663 start_codon:yes stop_codon:yes gene_type:complete